MRQNGEEGRVSVVALALILAACAGGEGGGPAFTERDSAGVTIVDNVRGSWSDAQSWRLSPEPIVDIGVLEGAPEYQLFRVGGALRLDDGRIVVANGGTGELRFYDEAGSYVSASGRKGEGPGEFEDIGWLRRYRGDSLIAYDFRQARTSVLDTDGNFGRLFRFESPGDLGRVRGIGPFTDGSIFASTSPILSNDFCDQATRIDVLYLVYSPTGEFVDSVGRFPGPERYVQTQRSGGGMSVMVTSIPFGKSPVYALHDQDYYYGPTETYEIWRFASDGTLRGIIRRPLDPVPVTDADLEAAIEERLQNYPDEAARRGARQTFASMTIPETMPAYDDLAVDVEGNLWVNEYEPLSDGPQHWTVFNAEGRMLGVVALPRRFRVTEIGEDYVLGISTDDLDVQHVRLYELIKPGA